MSRVTWLQRKGALIGVLALFGACALAIVVEQLGTHASFASYVAHDCTAKPFQVPCGTIHNSIAAGSTGFTVLVVAVALFPVAIGVFVGAPLLARELESGTFRFTWTQEVGRTRSVVMTLTLLAGLAAVAGSMLGLLLGWSGHRFEVIGIESQQWSGIFDATALTLGAWSVFGLALGTLLGALIGRSVAAMAAAAVGIAVPDPGRWVHLDDDAFLVRHFPASPFWLLQGLEAAVLIGLAALFGLATVWWVRRHA
jgi:hypothetical protein